MRLTSVDFAPYGAGLSTKCDADIAYIVAIVECPERDCVLAGTGNAQVERVTFLAAVRYPVIREDFPPLRAVNADISTFDAARGVLDIKHRPDTVAGDLDLDRVQTAVRTNCANSGSNR